MIDASFWHERWTTNQIPFHEPKPNPLLTKYFNRLQLRKRARVFVPLCGKTLDIGWLLAQGHHVAGAELSPIAIEQLFAQLRLEPKIKKERALTHYSAPGIDIFVGDIFKLTATTLGRVDAIYDRAALVALPPEVRKRYTAHLRKITSSAPQLIVTFDYDQNKMSGPPFAIPNDELVQHYGKSYEMRLLASSKMPGGLKGKVAAVESLWALAPLK